ncbi:MAG: potassium transporter, partial [Sphingobacteriia bacterium]|nr:potassium transporter [Sphingobacteriia bacterium]
MAAVLVIGRIIGVYALLFGVTLITPILVALWYRELDLGHFIWPMAGSLGLGALLWLTGRPRLRHELNVRDGYLIVALFWLLLSLLGAWPLWMGLGLSPIDALFESASGLTTTGATVISGLDALPRSLLF